MRRTSLFEDLIKLPWPFGVGLAAMIFLAFHAYQWFAPQTQISQALFSAMSTGVNVLIGVCLFASLLSFLTQRIRSKRFKATKSMPDLRSLSWRQFESYVGEMFRDQGYFVMETEEGPDNGVDLVLRKDGEKTYVQCKHWKSATVGLEKIRELLGAMTAGGAHNGIFVITGSYTKPAREFARECGIKLVGGEELARLFGSLLEQSNDRPDTSEQRSEVACPVCKAPMVKRTAKRGPNAGNEFWGCSTYPGCRGIRQV